LLPSLTSICIIDPSLLMYPLVMNCTSVSIYW
jgi:hypothetical protein